MDIMATTSPYLEQGYDKAYRWLMFEFRRIGRESQVEFSSIMREAILDLASLMSEADRLTAGSSATNYTGARK